MSHVDWPSRTLLTVRPARQDAILPRHMTTTALDVQARSFTGAKCYFVTMKGRDDLDFPSELINYLNPLVRGE